MKKERRRPSAHRAIRWRIMALVLALWLAGMGLITWAVAADMQVQIENQARFFTTGGTRNMTRDDDIPEGLPGSMEAGMIDSLGSPYVWLSSFVDPLIPIMSEPNGVGTDDWIWGKWDLYYGFEAAVAYFREDTLLMDTGNYFSFIYTTQENWEVQNVEPVSHGHIDLDAVPGGVETLGAYLLDIPTGDVGASLFLDILRMTGYFEGVEFHPVSVDIAHTNHGYTLTREQMSRADSRGNLTWNTILTAEQPADRELVTIYAWEADGILHENSPVTVEGTRYESLTALVSTDRENWGHYHTSNLLESVFIWRMPLEDSYGEYTYALAVRYWPLRYAVMRLMPAYLISFAIVAGSLLLILLTVRRRLTKPMEELAEAIRWSSSIRPTDAWAEPRALEEYYETSRQALHEANTRIAQLNTAMEYAKNAEENRRQLVSNITHELKTPLAVIHSYAEGLQMDVSLEKKDQYINVILEETERMDAMVLQMLDLSRLEAGRVRLASDNFSLLALTQSVVEKMEPLARERNVAIGYDFTEEFTITADEARMGQVITNLVSNAVKYSVEDTEIRLKVYAHRGSAWFYIENVCPHLSDEALEKVWDSFYRADPSRRSPGTGLGLTIVRTIVELHQGSCTVRNTTRSAPEGKQECVQFGFSLPMA